MEENQEHEEHPIPQSEDTIVVVNDERVGTPASIIGQEPITYFDPPIYYSVYNEQAPLPGLLLTQEVADASGYTLKDS
jgi:hypothetical protein